MTLVADCATDTTIEVPNGDTLDGNGHKITAVDPSGRRSIGAVVQNDGATMHVKNLKIGVRATRSNNCDRAFNGVAFMAASGSIKGVTLTNIGHAGTGCQIGRAILVDNIAGADPAVGRDRGQHRLGLQQERDRRARQRRREDHREHRHGHGEQPRRPERHRRPARVPGGPSTDTATAQVWGNTISGNSYTPGDWIACGILVIGKATST